MSRRTMHTRLRDDRYELLRDPWSGTMFRIRGRRRNPDVGAPPFLFEVRVYDPETDTWDFMRDLPSRRAARQYVNFWITRGATAAARYAHFAWKRRGTS